MAERRSDGWGQESNTQNFPLCDTYAYGRIGTLANECLYDTDTETDNDIVTVIDNDTDTDACGTKRKNSKRDFQSEKSTFLHGKLS